MRKNHLFRGGIITENVVKKTKLFIPFGICFLVQICSIFYELLFGEFPSPSFYYNLYYVTSAICEMLSLLCVIGAFLFDIKEKHRGAVVFATIFLVCALGNCFWNVIRSFGLNLSSMTYVIPAMLLMMFITSRHRSRRVWIVAGIFMLLWMIFIKGMGIFFRNMYHTAMAFVYSISYGLIYLFGFMNTNRTMRKTNFSYLEQYKQEHEID